MTTLQRHILGAGAGLAGLAAIGYLLTRGFARAAGRQLEAQEALIGRFLTLTGPPRGSVVGSVSAALLIAVTAVIAGGLCGWRRLSPVAPLVAGLPLLGFGLVTWTGFPQLRPSDLFGAGVTARLPGVPLLASIDIADMQLAVVLGGAMVVAALVRGGWTGRPADTPPLNAHLPGALAGLIAIPVLGFLAQLTDFLLPPSYGLDVIWLPAALRQSALFWHLEPILLAAALGVLAASRPLPRVAALTAGVPLVAVGLLGLLGPATAVSLIGGPVAVQPQPWREGLLLFVVSGLPLLYGGLLVAAGLSSDRLLRLRRLAPEPAPLAVADPY